MKARRTVTVLLGAIALIFAGVTAANAGQIRSYTCSGGDISGTYSSVTVKGDCHVPKGATLTVRGNLTLAPGAELDATQFSTSHLKVGGNVVAGRGSTFAMGCTEAHPCSADGGSKAHPDTVHGNVLLIHVSNAAINGSKIGGNLISVGGGAPADQHQSFSIKDDTIRGNVVVTGLSTDWFGVIRSTIGGNVTLIGNRGARLSDAGVPDSNEVVANTIGGNLVCFGNDPANQFGDATDESQPNGGFNQVGGVALGQCADLTR